MTDEVLLALAGIIIAALIYFAETQRSRLHAKDEQNLREKSEQDRRRHELKTRMVEEYASVFATRQDAGPHLLARLGLPQLRTDCAIREVIAEIQRRTGHDPWEGAAAEVSGVDLLAFFEAAAVERVDFTRVQVSHFAATLTKPKRSAA